MFTVLRSAAALAALVASMLTGPANAETVTRKSKNLYKVDGSSVWLYTRYCYEYAYSEEAVLRNGELIFVDSGAKCNVRLALKETTVKPGTYEVSVSQEDDDLYSTADDFYLSTSMCMELGIGEDAIFKAQAFGGTLTFLDKGRQCEVERVFSRLRL